MSIEKTNKVGDTSNVEKETTNPFDEKEKILWENLPKPLQGLTKDFTGREKEIVLLSSIGVLSNCIPNVYGIYDGQVVFPHLYIVIIAPAASGKGAMNYSRHLIKPIHELTLENGNLKDVNDSKKSNKKPSLKILPANISSSEMYSYMNSSDSGVLIIESEADTLSKMFKNDWSNFSDILRKAFHHEEMSMARKGDNIYLEVNEPKLSIVISGTPDQLKPLIISNENGLYSRFLMYRFNDISPFKNVFDNKSKKYKQKFITTGEEILELYKKLLFKKPAISFQFTSKQEKLFEKQFGSMQNDIINNQTDDLIPNLRRHGLIMFRICMIFTVLKNKDSIEKSKILVCTDTDYENALSIISSSLKQLIENHTYMGDGVLSKQDEDLLFSVNETFTRQELIEVGLKQNVPTRTIDDKIKQWRKKKVIMKISHGSFKRTLR